MQNIEILNKAEIGTLMHLILQKLDFRENYNEKTLNDLIQKLIYLNIVTEKQSQYIDKKRLLEFTKTELFKEIQNAKEIYKEQPFHMSVIDENTKVVTSIDDTIFPMFLPENTKLQAQDTIAKSDGERVILTFSGDKPFVLVEETVSIPKELEIIPTIGEPTLLMDTIGSLSTNSVSWIRNGMEYYVASEVMSQDELISVAKSISTIPVMK